MSGVDSRESAPYTRVWFNGRIPASQAGDAGSIPVTRSKTSRPTIRQARVV